jgi:hypothetical protein
MPRALTRGGPGEYPQAKVGRRQILPAARSLAVFNRVSAQVPAVVLKQVKRDSNT